ncbi:MAG TPA: hypothetical protein VFB99_13275 [Vicinamibacterales bacterium]|nr:hypothetical protein [Vicinamibacterales bacterium]
MAFLLWLESTDYSNWILTSTAGWPLMLTTHAIGLAIVVGITFSLNLRLLGLYGTIPYTSLRELMGFAWVGIALNTVTGLSLFMTQASSYVVSIPFLLKITFIILGVVNLVYAQKILRLEASGWQAAGSVSRRGLALAGSSLFLWVAAVVTGRLIAYL